MLAVGRKSSLLVRALPTTERGRAALWRAFIRTKHAPSELKLAIACRRYLRDARQRYADRLERILDGGEGKAIRRNLSLMEWSELFATVFEDAAMGSASSPSIGRAMARAFRWAIREVGAASKWSPTLSPLDQQVGELVTRVGQTTRAQVRRIVTDGLENGATIAEIQEGLMESPAFGPSRALMIARTETTRAVSGGTDFALQAAAEEGIIVKRQWLSARDAAVRESHREMDGQEVAVGERFVSPSGRKATHPGGFGIPSEDINCRCTVLPVVD